MKKTPKNEKTTKQLLGTFYSDKQCLENLLKDESKILFHIQCFLNVFFFVCIFQMLITILSCCPYVKSTYNDVFHFK